MTYAATVIADSLPSFCNSRLTTMKVTMPRFILAEFNTHRMFSRNAGSSRAISVKRRIDAVRESPFVPEEWGKNKPGMQASELISEEEASEAEIIWREAARKMTNYAEALSQRNVHKQLVNRLLEPFTWVDVIVTATEWKNFFTLRISELAQPEIQKVALCMRKALEESVPNVLLPNEWHIPTVTRDDILAMNQYEDLLMVAAGRLARVSYERQDSQWQKDLSLAQTLLKDGHFSPFEHIAQCRRGRSQYSRNFGEGWDQLRGLIEDGEFNYRVKGTYVR